METHNLVRQRSVTLFAHNTDNQVNVPVIKLFWSFRLKLTYSLPATDCTLLEEKAGYSPHLTSVYFTAIIRNFSTKRRSQKIYR